MNNPLASGLDAHLASSLMKGPAPKAEPAAQPIQHELLIDRVQKTIDTWDKENTFDPQLGPPTMRRWLMHTQWAPYAIIGALFVVTLGVFIGLLALLRPSIARVRGEGKLSWGKTVLWSVFFALLCAGAAFAAHWLEASSRSHQ